MSIKEIKAMTGFSYSTISRVLNNRAAEFRISPKTSQKILKAAHKLNYRPNILARSLRLRKTHVIGLIVSDIQNPFFGELASRIETLLRQSGYSTILCNTNEIPENEEFYLKILVDRQVDGIIIAPVHTSEWKVMEDLCKEKPMILIDRIFFKTKLPWVTSENTKASEALTKELLGQGYRKIGFLGGIPNTYIADVRYKGYEKALREKQIPLDKSLLLFKGYSREAGEEMMTKLLEKRSDIEAVFCINNLVFFGAMKVVHEHERKNNCSIMMAAFDVGQYCDIFGRPLISADQNLPELAHAAVNLILPRISNAQIKENHVVLPITINKHRLD
jgi:LacI family transcriptional regulator